MLLLINFDVLNLIQDYLFSFFLSLFFLKTNLFFSDSSDYNREAIHTCLYHHNGFIVQLMRIHDDVWDRQKPYNMIMTMLIIMYKMIIDGAKTPGQNIV